MARAGITFSEVKSVIEQLQAKNKNLTVENVRQVLGRGSNSTIARFLREWKAQHDIPWQSPHQPPPQLVHIITQVWDQLSEQSDKKIKAYEQEAVIKIAESEQILRDSIKKISALEEKIHQLEEGHQQDQQQKKLLTDQMIGLQTNQTKLTERNIYLESHLQQAKKENNRLHQLLKNMQANLEHYQESIHQLREQEQLAIDKNRQIYETKIQEFEKNLMLTTQEKIQYHTELN